MRIRYDATLVSSLLMTIGLLSLVPMSWAVFLSGYDWKAIERLDPGFQESVLAWARVGQVSMVVICIGLIVTWTGYVKRVRSAWFIMFIIVWFWAFPLFVKGFISEITGTPLPKLVSTALTGWGRERVSLYAVAHITPMVIALILPVKSFFWGGKST